MKAPDLRAERWMLKHGESIIERLLAISSRVVGVKIATPTVRTRRDRYYTAARRLRVRQLMRERG